MEARERRSLGEIIRREREKKGISIEYLSDVTKISKEFIKAIEEENFDVLPGDVYVKGFIRNISLALGLDPDELKEIYKAIRKESYDSQVLKEAKEKLPAYDANVEKSVKPKRPWLLITFLLVLLLGGGLYFYASWTGSINILSRTFLKGSQVAQVPSSESLKNEAKEGLVAHSTQSIKHEEAVSSATTSLPTMMSTQSLPLASSAPEKPVTHKAEKLRLKVIAVGRCWIRVLADGKKIFEGVLVKGDEKLWEAEENIMVRFGNIAGVKVYFNDKEVPLPSSKGGVVDMVFP
ncbi:MAG: DUF4115 domain-containing protein [Synergistetes bacterium]|nr:DUF4115 domain-containing protein [Synergistota bacterium]MCX8127865.1 DUF4115 domain-containing protein [Synergistota bacterium]MDW8192127.1 DUF4115 domain-containing protein [Synergistota bacterium]